MAELDQKREDHRTAVTKTMIRSALMHLLEAKPIGNINVSELCRAANISRGTFYAHYSTPESVLWEIRDEVTSRLSSYVFGPNTTVYDFMVYNCQVCLQNKDFCTLLMRDPTTRAVYQRGLLENNPSMQWLRGFPKHPTEEQSIRRFQLLSVAEGIGGIVNDWCERGMVEPPELVARVAADFYARCNTDQ